jgi:hypothetical protein
LQGATKRQADHGEGADQHADQHLVLSDQIAKLGLGGHYRVLQDEIRGANGTKGVHSLMRRCRVLGTKRKSCARPQHYRF